MFRQLLRVQECGILAWLRVDQAVYNETFGPSWHAQQKRGNKEKHSRARGALKRRPSPNRIRIRRCLHTSVNMRTFQYKVFILASGFNFSGQASKPGRVCYAFERQSIRTSACKMNPVPIYKCSWFVANPEKSLLVETLELAHSPNQKSKTLE